MKTFYRPEMSVATNDSSSPSAGKPKAFIEYLQKTGHKLDLVSDFAPATRMELQLAHERAMVEGILKLRMDNGFGNRSEDIARSLPYTSGSMLAAAEYAVVHGVNTFSPTSGFHHAGHGICGGYCSFNGLMVAALGIKVRGKAEYVGILDFDRHYGDGTEDIIIKTGQRRISHYSFGEHRVTRQNAEDWMKELPKILDFLHHCDVVLYQAGADPHVDDPLGGILTTAQMAKRDEMVFNYFRRMNIPVAWNLAGGYQKPLEKVLELHKTTYEMAIG